MKLKHKPVKRSEFYRVSGDKAERIKRICDRCGDGTFMAEHKDRWYCGKCGMTIWKNKKSSDNKPADETISNTTNGASESKVKEQKS